MSIVSTFFFNNLLPLLQQLHGFRATFSNRFWISSYHSTFCAPIHFFCNKIKTMQQLLLKQLFLVWKVRARGGAFGAPSGLSIGTPRSRFSFFGTFLGTDFQEPLFLQKMHFGSQKVLQNGSKINSGSDLGCHFYIFQRTLILNDPPMILTYL